MLRPRRLAVRLATSLLAALTLAGTAQASPEVVGGIAAAIGHAIRKSGEEFTLEECGQLTRALVKPDPDEDRWPKHNIYKYDFGGTCMLYDGPVSAIEGSAAFDNGTRTAYQKIEILDGAGGELQVTASCPADPFRYQTVCSGYQWSQQGGRTDGHRYHGRSLAFAMRVPEDIEHEVQDAPPPPPPPAGSFEAKVREPADRIAQAADSFVLALDATQASYPPAKVKHEWQWRHEQSGQDSWLPLYTSQAQPWERFPLVLSTDLFSAGNGSYRVRLHTADPDGSWLAPGDWHTVGFGLRRASATGAGLAPATAPGRVARTAQDPEQGISVKPNTLAIKYPSPGQTLANDPSPMKLLLETTLDIAAPGMGGRNGVIHVEWRYRLPGGSWQSLPWNGSVACRGGRTAVAVGAPRASCHAPADAGTIDLTIQVAPQPGEYEVRVKPARQSIWSPPRRFSVVGPQQKMQAAPSAAAATAAKAESAPNGTPARAPRAGLAAREDSRRLRPAPSLKR